MTPLVLGEIRRLLWGSQARFTRAATDDVRQHGLATADTGLALDHPLLYAA
jgi:hypothetical protein